MNGPIIRRLAAVLAAAALAAGLAAPPLAATGHDTAPSIIECWSFFDSDGSSVTVCTDDPVWVDTDGRYFVVTTAGVSPRRVYLPIPAYAPPADAPDRTDAVPLADLPEAQADVADAQPDLPDAPAAVFATLDTALVQQAEEAWAAAAASCSTSNLVIWHARRAQPVQNVWPPGPPIPERVTRTVTIFGQDLEVVERRPSPMPATGTLVAGAFFTLPNTNYIAVQGSQATASNPAGQQFGEWVPFTPPSGGCQADGLYLWQAEGFTADLGWADCDETSCEFSWGDPGAGSPAGWRAVAPGAGRPYPQAAASPPPFELRALPEPWSHIQGVVRVTRTNTDPETNAAGDWIRLEIGPDGYYRVPSS